MTILAGLGALAVVGLLWSEWRINRRTKWIFKPLASALFVLAGIVAGIDSDYGILIFVGLVCGAVGDVLLIPDHKPRWFLAGLGIFLLGHVAYVIAFGTLVDVEDLVLANFVLKVVLVFVGSIILGLLLPILGNLKIPVALYILVISVMVVAALTVYAADYPTDFRRLVAAGALCFYFSDLAVALDRFVQPKVKQAYWGLPLYYAAQFMLAFSIAAYAD